MSLTILQEAAGLADDDCMSWHKYCNAECCRTFTIRDIGQDLSVPEIILHAQLDTDMQKYYRLHGCRVGHGKIYVPTKNITRDGKGQLWVNRTCDYLTDDLKCKHHGTAMQPRICRDFTLSRLRDTSRPIQAVATPRCLFTAKLALEKTGGPP